MKHGLRCWCVAASRLEEELNRQVDITKDDSSSADQLRDALRGLAGDKVSPDDDWLHYGSAEQFSHS
jgi:hypothetical protein